MKKKVVAIFIVGMLLGGIVTFASVTEYYSQLLRNQQGQMENEIERIYDERITEIGRQTHADMVMRVAEKRDEVMEEMEEYLIEQLAIEQNRRYNEHSKEIDKEAEQLKKELEKYIDELIEDSNK